MGESKYNLSGASIHGESLVIGDGNTVNNSFSQSKASKEELQALFRSLMDRQFGENASAQKVVDAVNDRLGFGESMGLVRSTVNTWLNQPGARPKEWWHACALTLVLCENTEEVNRFLTAANHMTLAQKKAELEKRSLATDINSGNIEAVILREWIA